jgi:hypothetical protein
MRDRARELHEKRVGRSGLSMAEYDAREASGLRHCTKCLVWKPTADFSHSKMERKGWSYRCRACRHEDRKRDTPIPSGRPGPVPTETQKAWMAGFIDGEGTISISRQKRKDRPSLAYRAKVSVANTTRASLDFFVSFYGGPIYDIHDRRTSPSLNWSRAFDWVCPMSSTHWLIADVQPYLVIKVRQAEIVSRFIDTKNGFSRTFWPGQYGGSAPLSTEESAHREALFQEVRMLNARGKKGEMERLENGIS